LWSVAEQEPERGRGEMEAMDGNPERALKALT